MPPSTQAHEVELATIRAEMGGLKDAISRVDESLEKLSESVGKLVELQLQQASLGKRVGTLESKLELIDHRVDTLSADYKADKQALSWSIRVAVGAAIIIQTLFGWWIQSQIQDMATASRSIPAIQQRLDAIEARLK